MKKSIFMILLLVLTACQKSNPISDSGEGKQKDQLVDREKQAACKMVLNQSSGLEEIVVSAYKLKSCGLSEGNAVALIR